MFKLNRQLKKLKERTSPKREFKRELWATLDKEYEDVYGPLPSAQPTRLMYRFAAVGIVVVVLFVATGTGVYAYNSPQVSEGHVLFPLKRSIERVECGFFRNPERFQACQARMVERRLNEAEIVPDSERRQMILDRAATELGVDPDVLRQRLLQRARQNLQEIRSINQKL